MRAQKAKPSRQLEDMSDISTSGYWLNSLLHHSCNAATPIISLRKKADSLYTIASKWIDMFYLKIIEQLFLFVEQLDQLHVCLPYSRLLTGIPILVVFQNLRWNSYKTSLIGVTQFLLWTFQGADESLSDKRALLMAWAPTKQGCSFVKVIH